jgi:hypothetical protein
MVLHPAHAGEKGSLAAVQGIRDQGTQGAAEDAKLGPPVGSAVLVLVAVVEGLEDVKQRLEGVVGAGAGGGGDGSREPGRLRLHGGPDGRIVREDEQVWGAAGRAVGGE